MGEKFRFQIPDYRVGCVVSDYPPLSWFRRLLACLLILAGPVESRADVSRPAAPVVPVAISGKAVAVRGFPVEIRLEGVTGTGRMLQFLIRQGPKHGRIEGPPVSENRKTTERQSAVVRYIANPGSTAESDSFSFATKIDGSGSSVEAEMTIKLVDPAPALDAPGGMDLGRFLAGEVIDKTIDIANKGNAPWRVTLPLPAGWSWLTPAGGVFALDPGDKMTASLRIRVAEPGPLDHKLVLNEGATVRIIGRAFPPFLAYPSLLRLQWDRATQKRGWRLTLRNNRPETATIRLSGPPGLLVPASVEVPAVESTEIPVGWSGPLHQPVSGKLVLEAPGWRQEVDFEAPVAPAAVEVTGTDADGTTVDFGVLETAEGPRADRKITLRNAGGTPSVIRWDPLRLFLLDGLEPEKVLPPGAEVSFTLRPRPDEPGRLKEELLLRMNGGDRSLKLAADIDPAAAKAALAQAKPMDVKPMPKEGAITGPKQLSEDGFKLRTQIFTTGLYETTPNLDRSLPVVDKIRFIEAESGPDKLVFEWLAPAPGNWKYLVRVRMLRFHGKGQPPIPEYGEMDNVEVSTTPTGGRAVVTKLRPEARWMCRVVAIREDGVSTLPSEDLVFITPPVPDSRWGWRVVGVFCALALGMYVRQKWREDVKWKD